MTDIAETQENASPTDNADVPETTIEQLPEEILQDHQDEDLNPDYREEGESRTVSYIEPPYIDTGSVMIPTEEGRDSGQTTQYISTSNIESSTNVEIALINPQIKKGVKNHVIYTVKGQDDISEYEAIRRYKDFFALRAVLITRWPGCFVPAIPPKQATGNHDAIFIEQRRKSLEEFLKQVADIKHIYESDEFQLFIRGPPDFEKNLSQVKKYALDQILGVYQHMFHQYADVEASQHVLNGIAQFRDFFAEVYNKLLFIKQVSTQACQAYNVYSAALTELSENFEFLEENLIAEYGGAQYDPVFKSPFDLTANHFDVLLAWAKSEELDHRAMLDAFNKVEELEQSKVKTEKQMTSDSNQLLKLQTGKKTIKSVFSTTSKPQQLDKLEAAITQAQKDIECYGKLIALVQTRLYDYECPKFKALKAKKYEEMMKLVVNTGMPQFGKLLAIYNNIEIRTVKD